MKPLVLRVFLWLLTRLFYRVTVLHSENIPSQGGALLISNHQSFVDMLLILASSRRPVRFLIAEEVCSIRLLKFPLRLLRVIPLPVETRARELTEALRLADRIVELTPDHGLHPVDLTDRGAVAREWLARTVGDLGI